MADKLAELEAALEGMPDEGLRIVAEFAEYLAKMQRDQKEKTKRSIGSAEGQTGGNDEC